MASPDRTARLTAEIPWLTDWERFMRFAQAGGDEEPVEVDGSFAASAAPPIVPSADVPPVASKAAFATLEKLCLTLPAVRDAARLSGDVAALAPARATAQARGNAGRACLAGRGEAIGSRGSTGERRTTTRSCCRATRHSPDTTCRRAKCGLARHHHAAGSKTRADSGACAELGSARDEAIGDAGSKNAEASSPSAASTIAMASSTEPFRAGSNTLICKIMPTSTSCGGPR